MLVAARMQYTRVSLRELCSQGAYHHVNVYDSQSVHARLNFRCRNGKDRGLGKAEGGEGGRGRGGLRDRGYMHVQAG